MDGILSDLTNLDPATRWWLVVAAALTMFYLIMRKRKDPLKRAEQPQLLSSQRAVERDMTNLLVELSEMARQTTAQLDTRAKKLELLIKQADERLAALKSASRPSEIAEKPPSPRHAEIPPPNKIDPRHLEVYVLSDEGFTASIISQRLNRPYGEVELILALRERTASI